MRFNCPIPLAENSSLDNKQASVNQTWLAAVREERVGADVQCRVTAKSSVDFKTIDLLEELKYENLVDEEKSEKGEFFDASVIQRPELKDGLLMTKVHYEGYGQEYDEWIPVTDVIGHIRVEPSDFPPVAGADPEQKID